MVSEEVVVPTKREQLHALVLAALCALLFVGSSILPGRSLVPFAPECMEPMRTQALADGASVELLETRQPGDGRQVQPVARVGSDPADAVASGGVSTVDA